MKSALVWIGRAAGALGVAICALGLVARVTAHYTVGSFQVGTLLLAGTAAMVAGCLALLWALTSRDGQDR